MAGTFKQLYIQVVFAVQGRENLINLSWRSEVHKYISGIITAKDQKSIIVNGVGDHVHCFIGLKPTIAISDLVRDIKNNSSKFINDRKFVRGKFNWQDGYGVFSYHHSQLETIYNYVLNQEAHHSRKSFKDEYLELLEEFEIPFDKKYLFDWIE